MSNNYVVYSKKFNKYAIIRGVIAGYGDSDCRYNGDDYYIVGYVKENSATFIYDTEDEIPDNEDEPRTFTLIRS